MFHGLSDISISTTVINFFSNLSNHVGRLRRWVVTWIRQIFGTAAKVEQVYKNQKGGEVPAASPQIQAERKVALSDRIGIHSPPIPEEEVKSRIDADDRYFKGRVGFTNSDNQRCPMNSFAIVCAHIGKKVRDQASIDGDWHERRTDLLSKIAPLEASCESNQARIVELQALKQGIEKERLSRCARNFGFNMCGSVSKKLNFYR